MPLNSPINIVYYTNIVITVLILNNKYNEMFIYTGSQVIYPMPGTKRRAAPTTSPIMDTAPGG